MEKIIQNTELDINLLLIQWSLMSGHLNDGIIEKTKFGKFNLWFCFLLCLFNGTKWSILILSPKESQMTNFLGEWAYFFGPKVIIDLIIVVATIYIIAIKIQFIFMSKNPKKMLYWIDAMTYDHDNQSFNKLNLIESQSKMFIKRLSLSLFLIQHFTYSFIIFFILVSCILVFKRLNHHFSNYLISILCYTPLIYYNIRFLFGFLAILYPVRDNIFNLF